MGTYSGSRNADLEYPLAFLESMGRVLEKKQPAREQPFRYIHLSGMFTRQDQEKKLLFLEFSRKIRVRIYLPIYLPTQADKELPHHHKRSQKF